MTTSLNSAIARIRKANGEIVGAGFLVGQRQVLTCAHVVAQALGLEDDIPEAPQAEVHVDFPLVAPMQLLTARVVCWQPRLADGSGDIAGLELLVDPPADALPMLLVKGEDKWGNPFRAFGFPRGYDNGVWASGRILDREATGWLQIEDVKRTGYFIQPGFSGGPVWDDSLRGVVGMTAAVESREAIRVAFIVPTEEIVAVWPDIKSALQEQLKQQWFSREQEVRASIISEELDDHDNPCLVESPLTKYWLDFIGRRAWHQEVASDLRLMRKAANSFRELKWLLPLIDTVDCDANYHVVVDALRTIVTDKLLSTVSRIVSRLDISGERSYSRSHYWREESESERLLREARQLRGHVLSLRDACRHPQFSRCFPVMGSLGSGKTHFCTWLMAHHHMQSIGDVEATVQNCHKNYLVLRLGHLFADSSLSELILKGVRESSSINWATLQDFSDYLEFIEDLQGGHRQPIRLVVVLDDLQSWMAARSDFKQELMSFIRDNSRLHSVYWLLALQDTDYDTVVHNSRGFWEKYSLLGQELDTMSTDGQRDYPRSLTGQPPHVGGWLMLDEMNRTEATGLQILRRNLGEEANGKELAAELLDSDDPTARYLTNPFIAWVLLELRDAVALETLVTLHFIEFIVHYWERRVSGLDHAPLSRTQLDQSIYLISAALVELADLTPRFAALVEYMAEAAAIRKSSLQEHDLADSAILVLERASLLKRITSADPESLSWVDERVQIRFEAFWELHIAQQLLENTASEMQRGKGLVSTVEALFETISLTQIREGVFEFFLLLTEQHRALADHSAMADVWYLGFHSDILPASSTWFAGAKASESNQRLLADWASAHKGSPLPRRVLFAFMHYLVEAPPTVLDVPARLSLLQPHYRAIHEAGLALYFLYMAGRLLDGVDDNEVILSSMIHFAGCEIMNVTLSLASLTVSRIMENAANDTHASLNLILRYLELEHLRLREGRNPTGTPTPQSTMWSRHFYREWLLFEFLRELLTLQGLTTYTMLAESSWYRPDALGIAHPVSLEMEREANIALGYWYRSSWSDRDKDGYVDLIASLVDSGDERERELAFWMIYHTEATHGRESVEVDLIFRPFLEDISLDARMAGLVARHARVFEANTGHMDSVYCLDVTPCGGFAISGSRDQTVKLWSIDKRRPVRTFAGHDGAIYWVSVTQDGGTIISASADKSLKVWDRSSGALVRTLVGHTDEVNEVVTTPDGLYAVSCSDDTTVRVWNIATGELLHTLAGHEARVYTLAVTADGRHIVSGSEDQTIRLWDTSDWNLVSVLAEHKGTVFALASLPGGFASACEDGMVKLWSVDSLHSHRTFWGFARTAEDMKVTKDGQIAISVHENGELRAWNLTDGQIVARLKLDALSSSCAVGPDGRTVIVGCDSGDVRFFGLGGGAFHAWN